MTKEHLPQTIQSSSKNSPLTEVGLQLLIYQHLSIKIHETKINVTIIFKVKILKLLTLCITSHTIT